MKGKQKGSNISEEKTETTYLLEETVAVARDTEHLSEFQRCFQLSSVYYFLNVGDTTYEELTKQGKKLNLAGQQVVV
jgi:hypothetical protein